MILVAGPPCAGKTTFVRMRASTSANVLDFDDIVEQLGYPRYGAPGSARARARGIWSAQLPLADWVIWTAPRRADRGRLRGQFGAHVIVLLTPLEECLRRAGRERPPSWQWAIKRWFVDFQPSRSSDEEIISPTSGAEP